MSATTFESHSEREQLYRATRQPEFVQVPEMAFVLVDGAGDPNTSKAFTDAIQALYSVSYTLKFDLKKATGLVYRVGPIEALWWAEDSAELPIGRKDDWHWTALIAQPDEVTKDRFDHACTDAGRKRELPALRRIRLDRFEEGFAAQIMHIGPYAAEAPTIAKLHAFIGEHGYTFDGRQQKHHEIYVGDPRRSAPEKLRTIIRQPVVAA